MSRTTSQWTVSLPPSLSREAEKLAVREHRTRSELVREALRRYLAEREQIEAIRRKIGRNLRAKGIRTLRDIEGMIDEGRT